MTPSEIAEKIADSEDVICASEEHEIEIAIKYLLANKN